MDLGIFNDISGLLDQPMDSAHNFSNYSNSSSDTGVSIGYPTKMGD